MECHYCDNPRIYHGHLVMVEGGLEWAELCQACYFNVRKDRIRNDDYLEVIDTDFSMMFGNTRGKKILNLIMKWGIEQPRTWNRVENIITVPYELGKGYRVVEFRERVVDWEVLDKNGNPITELYPNVVYETEGFSLAFHVALNYTKAGRQVDLIPAPTLDDLIGQV